MPIYIQGVEQSSGGAPTDADYLVGTTQGGLSAEIVAGAAPGGELGGTWAAPTVDATHSGSAHHAESHAHSSHTGIGATDHHSNANDHAQAHGPAQHTTGTAWRDTYQDALGDDTEIALGAAGTYKRSAGAAAAPTYAQPAHSELSGIGATDHHSNVNDHANTILAHGPSAHTTGTAWRALYLNSLGDETELILGASGTVFQSNGASSAPSFATPTTAAHGASSHDDRTRKLLYPVGGHGTETTAGGLTDVGAITSGTVGTPVLELSEAVDDGISFIAIMPSDMVAGTPTAVIILRTATSHASNWAVLLNALELGAGADITGGGTNTDTTIPGGSSTTVQRRTLTFPIATLAPNDVFRLDFERNASTDAASDTATDVLQFMAIELAYTADM